MFILKGACEAVTLSSLFWCSNWSISEVIKTVLPERLSPVIAILIVSDEKRVETCSLISLGILRILSKILFGIVPPIALE